MNDQEFSDRSKVLSKAVAKAAGRLNLDSADLSAIMGQESESDLNFVNFYILLASLLGSDALAKDWMTSPNKAFNQQTPLEYMKHEDDGLIKVREYLNQFV